MKTITAQKNLLFQIILLTSLALSFALNAKAEVQERAVKNFNKVEISSAFEVTLTQGTTESLTIEAEDHYLSKIITEVKGGTLIIRIENNTNVRGTLKANLTFIRLEGISVSGAVKLQGNGPMKFGKLELDGSGASKVDLSFSASGVDADFSGASEITLSGSSGNFNLDVSGASKLDAIAFKTENCRLECSGASKVSVSVSGLLTIEGSGASQVSYTGNPEVNSDLSGASTLRKI